MIECMGGPLDGQYLSAKRGEFFRVVSPGWSGTYQREGPIFRWMPD